MKTFKDFIDFKFGPSDDRKDVASFFAACARAGIDPERESYNHAAVYWGLPAGGSRREQLLGLMWKKIEDEPPPDRALCLASVKVYSKDAPGSHVATGCFPAMAIYDAARDDWSFLGHLREECRNWLVSDWMLLPECPPDADRVGPQRDTFYSIRSLVSEWGAVQDDFANWLDRREREDAA